MRHAIGSLAILIGTAGAVLAQPRPPAVGAMSAHEMQQREAQQREAQAHQDAFDAKIRRRSDAAVRSICAGCDTKATRMRSGAGRRIEAMSDPDGTADEHRLVEDPAAAPAE